MSGEMIEVALKYLKCNQNELAQRLQVSPTQITKWKQGEHMSFEMDRRLRAMIKIGQVDPLTILWAGSLKHARKWHELFHEMAEFSQDCGEANYNSMLLTECNVKEEDSLLTWHTIHTLNELGVVAPPEFPEFLLEAAGDKLEDEEHEEWTEKRTREPYYTLIWALYNAYSAVFDFHAAYILPLENALNDDFSIDTFGEVDACLMSLAAVKMLDDPEFKSNLIDKAKAIHLSQETRRNYAEWLTEIKNLALAKSVPLKAELMDLLRDGAETLQHTAEAESLGFNERRLHPDIYMNEVMVNLRVTRQMLETIMDKLKINFEINDLDLRSDGE